MSIIINNLSVVGAGAANDIGAASGADTPAKLKTLIGTTDSELLQLEDIVASGLDALADGSVYRRASNAEVTQVENIIASGLDAIPDGTVYKRTTAAGKTAADAKLSINLGKTVSATPITDILCPKLLNIFGNNTIPIAGALSVRIKFNPAGFNTTTSRQCKRYGCERLIFSRK